MKAVNFYEAEVKYTGYFEDYSLDQLYKMAKAKVDKGVDVFDHTEIVTDERAVQLDGEVRIINHLPCNKLVIIGWSYIDDSEDEV